MRCRGLRQANRCLRGLTMSDRKNATCGAATVCKRPTPVARLAANSGSSITQTGHSDCRNNSVTRSTSDAQLGIVPVFPEHTPNSCKRASARFWTTTSGSVHLSRQGFPTVHSSGKAKLISVTLQRVEGLG